ncbi:MAG: hypothetical protein JWN94_4999 [Betaproteobacteria bacterium]|nr:hypothetical protein [Betaproteobacteria bacterium]
MIRRTALAAIACMAFTCAFAAAAPGAVNAEYALSKDGLYIANVVESFHVKDDQYRIESDSTPAGVLAAFVRTRIKVLSSGSVTPAGLQPEKSEYTRLDDASKNLSAVFNWPARELNLAYEGKSEKLPLPSGIQDRLSVMYQFMFLTPDKVKRLEFQMTNGKKIENYRYDLAGTEVLDTPLGKIKTLHLVKHRDPGENGAEVWLATDRNLFPVKLAILENDGSRFEQTITRLNIK